MAFSSGGPKIAQEIWCTPTDTVWVHPWITVRWLLRLGDAGGLQPMGRGGLWRSLVSALDWGSRGPGFKSRQPD